jgi:hypothetical protein
LVAVLANDSQNQPQFEPQSGSLDRPRRAMLSAKDQRLLEALLVADTIRAAAEVAGMSERSAYRRMNSPGFSGELMMRRAAILRGAARRLAAEVDHSIDRLVALRDGQDTDRT